MMTDPVRGAAHSIPGMSGIANTRLEAARALKQIQKGLSVLIKRFRNGRAESGVPR